VSSPRGWPWAGSASPSGRRRPGRGQGVVTGEGLARFTSNLGADFIGFPPLVTVVTIPLAIGIAEKTGFLW